MQPSIYARVLGPGLEQARPGVRRYLVGPTEPGRHGRGTGVFAETGASTPVVAAVLRLLAPSRVLFGERGRDVPFTVANHPHRDAHGRVCLSAVREVRFPRRTRQVVDTMVLGQDGRIHDFLGSRRRVEITLDVVVTPEGRVRMTSTALYLWLGRRRVRVPALLGARVALTEDWDDTTGRHLITLDVHQPLLGTIFGYRGAFDYDTDGAGAHPPPDSGAEHVARRFRRPG